MSATTTFRLRDAARDLARRPTGGSLVVAAVLAIACVPLVTYALAASRQLATAPDGRAAMKLYTTWCVVSILGVAITSRCAAAIIASAMVARRDRDEPLSITETVARALAHGVPALVAAILTVGLLGLGVIGALVAWLPLACAAFVAVPVAAAEQLGPSAAIRRSAALTRGRWRPLLAFTIAILAVEVAPIVIARVTMLKGAKPPVAPILRMQQLHGWILIAAVIVTAAAPIVVYRRLRDTRP